MSVEFNTDAYRAGKEAQAAFKKMMEPRLAPHQKLVEEPFGQYDVDFGVKAFNYSWECVIGLHRRIKSWKGGRFPFKTIHVPLRYIHEVKKYSAKGTPYVHVQISDDLTDYVEISAKAILEHLKSKNVATVKSYRGKDKHVDIPVNAEGVTWHYQ